MFNKEKFAQIIKNIKEMYNSQEEFSKKSDIGRTYLSQYMNMKLEEPPKPRILEKLANASNGTVTFKELMNICGYSEKTLESKVLSIYELLKKYHKYINNGKSDKTNNYEIEGFIEYFQEYLDLLNKSIDLDSNVPVILEDIFNFSTAIEDYMYIGGFILLYNQFILSLESEDLIVVNDYNFIDCFNIEDIYNNLNKLQNLELLSYCSKNISIKNKNKMGDFIEYIDSFSRCLSLAHLSEYSSNSLIDFFKKKAHNTSYEANDIQSKTDTANSLSPYNQSIYMCPVYGRIAAGDPNWAEECMEGKMPIDPELMNIINPEECYFLKVNGESMNKVIKNGAFALIRKTDWVENGEIAVVLVNGFDATLKKFTKQGDLVILEPMSNDPNYTTQVYNKDTEIKIIGKYIGKMEMN